jgi:hypothetical protein
LTSAAIRTTLRAPALRQQPLDDLGQHRIPSEPARARLARPPQSGLLGVMGTVVAVRVAVAPDLAADRRRRTPQLLRDSPHTHPRRQQIRDLDPLLL